MKAVVFVDVQKDFIDGALRNEKAIEVTPKIVEFAKECIEKGYKLYATRDTHEGTMFKYDIDKGIIKLNEDNPPISGYLTTLEGQKLPAEHCIEGTDGWMIDERLWNVIEGKVTVINKPTFGSFDLAEIIEEDAVILAKNKMYAEHTNFYNTDESYDEIVLCGFCTDICVISNAFLLRAKFPNTKITVMKDLCAGVTKAKHNAALEVMNSCQIDVA